MADEPGDEATEADGTTEVDDTTEAPAASTTRAAARKAAAEAAAKAPATTPGGAAKPGPAKSLARPTAAKPAATSRTGGARSVPKKAKKPDVEAIRAASRSGNPAKKAAALAESSRYTPPVPSAEKISPWYVPAFMFGFLILGMLVIFLNYIEWPFGDASNWRLLGGLGSILAGILVATRYH